MGGPFIFDKIPNISQSLNIIPLKSRVHMPAIKTKLFKICKTLNQNQLILNTGIVTKDNGWTSTNIQIEISWPLNHYLSWSHSRSTVKMRQSTDREPKIPRWNSDRLSEKGPPWTLPSPKSQYHVPTCTSDLDSRPLRHWPFFTSCTCGPCDGFTDQIIGPKNIRESRSQEFVVSVKYREILSNFEILFPAVKVCLIK